MDPVKNFFSLTCPELQDFFAAIGEKPYRATQMMKWVYQHGVIDIDGMTDIGKSLRRQLVPMLGFELPEIVSEKISADGTIKWLLKVDDKNSIETVFIPEKDRGTLCVSSQAGCALDCRFCFTGKQGFGRNLALSEIIGQLWLANHRLGYFTHRNRTITNIVMMGMGEPLLNFENVTRAIELMKNDLGFGLASKRITLSTAGIVPAIDKLAGKTKVSLAVSLHAPSNDLRDILVPVNRSYPLDELLAACRRFSGKNNHDPVTFEYVMLDGVNDSTQQARQLVRILQGMPSKINLIPFNPFPDSGYTCSSREKINRFRDVLTGAGIVTITRKTRGDDIDAACGQLAGHITARASRFSRAKMSVTTGRAGVQI